MRRATDNPFRPGSDTVPTIWAGRASQLRDWNDIVKPRLESGLPERGRTILGEAGLGKSALVRRIAESAERQGAWVTPQLRVPVGADAMKIVAAALLKLADHAGLPAAREQRIKDLLNRVRTVSVQGVSLSLERATGLAPHSALTDLLVEIGKAAVKQNRLVLLHLDEVQNITSEIELSQLLISIGDAITYEETVVAPGGVKIQRTLPIAIYLTGLPDFMELAGSKRGATFARRFATTTLMPISDADLELALRPLVVDGWSISDDDGGTTVIRMSQDAASQIVKLSHGEPFLFQLAGERAWLAGTGNVISLEDVLEGWAETKQEAAQHVERILDRLPKRERQFVEAMAALPPNERTITNIAKTMGHDDATKAGATAQRLDTVRGIVERGKPYLFRHRAVEAYLTTNWPIPEVNPRRA